MTEQLLQEKEQIELRIKDQESHIERIKIGIYWDKKRLKLVEQQIAALKEEKPLL